MTVNELITYLERIRDHDGGELMVVGNHPGSGCPWGEIIEVRVENDPPRVVVDQGQE